eukprot:UN20850
MIVTLISFYSGLTQPLGHVSPQYEHPKHHNTKKPPIYTHRRFLAIFREFLNKMSQKITFLVNTC